MVFDQPPCNNHEVPQYFLRKLYCEFVLNEIPNYFDFLDFQGRGGGSSHDREGAQRDPNLPPRPLAKPMVEHVIIPSIVKESIKVKTLDSISSLTHTLIQYARPLVEGDASDDVDSSRHRVPTYFCRSCGSLYTYDPNSSENAHA